jgi:hypothetical protein
LSGLVSCPRTKYVGALARISFTPSSEISFMKLFLMIQKSSGRSQILVVPSQKDKLQQQSPKKSSWENISYQQIPLINRMKKNERSERKASIVNHHTNV